METFSEAWVFLEMRGQGLKEAKHLSKLGKGLPAPSTTALVMHGQCVWCVWHLNTTGRIGRRALAVSAPQSDMTPFWTHTDTHRQTHTHTHTHTRTHTHTHTHTAMWWHLLLVAGIGELLDLLCGRVRVRVRVRVSG